MLLNGVGEDGERIHCTSLGSGQDNFPDWKEIIRVRGLGEKETYFDQVSCSSSMIWP